MVSAREALAALRELLEAGGVPDAGYEAGEIFREVFGAHPLAAGEVSKEQLGKMKSLAESRAAGEPLQYLFGKWEFYGLPFFVGRGVLIPRPETELLVEFAVNRCQNGGKLLDLCSGTGCIAVAAAKHTSAEVYAAELYEEAFSYLERNIRLNEADVTAVRGDALDGELFGEIVFDLIVSNPPYLTAEEMRGLQREVRREPETALFGGEDGLDFYRRLIPLWKGRLKPGGCMAFEVGDGQAAAVKALFAAEGLSAGAIPDYQRIERVVFGKKPEIG